MLFNKIDNDDHVQYVYDIYIYNSHEGERHFC